MPSEGIADGSVPESRRPVTQTEASTKEVEDQSRRDQRRRRDLAALLNVAQAGLAVVGVLLYGALYLAYSAFYDQFGLTPADVGFGYADTLLRSSGLLLLLTILLATIIGSFFLWRSVEHTTRTQIRRARIWYDTLVQGLQAWRDRQWPLIRVVLDAVIYRIRRTLI